MYFGKKNIYILWFVLFFLFGCAQNKDTYQTKHISTALRNVGHEILLSNGDSTSIVLPITSLNKGEYMIRFEGNFSFSPHRLVNTVRATIDNTNLPKEYIVEIVNCVENDIVYSFQIQDEDSTQNKYGNYLQNIIPCGNRSQPFNCYQVKITFHQLTKDTNIYNHHVFLYISVIGLIGMLSLFVFFKGKNTKIDSNIDDHITKIGIYSFDMLNKQLSIKKTIIPLTEKEGNLLHILIEHKNECVDKEALLHHVWEDEGSYVGRTLDVFISRLRKKIKDDEAVNIVNIHGKGYKLVVN